jgi:hypothetical protein
MPTKTLEDISFETLQEGFRWCEKNYPRCLTAKGHITCVYDDRTLIGPASILYSAGDKEGLIHFRAIPHNQEERDYLGSSTGQSFVFGEKDIDAGRVELVKLPTAWYELVDIRLTEAEE